MKFSLSNRLLAVALLGVFSCAVSLFGLGRILQLTTAVRVDRAREAVQTELALMARDGVGPVRVATLGMRGGYVSDAGMLDGATDLEEPVRRDLVDALRLAEKTHGAVLREGESADPIVVLGAAPTSAGSYAWIAYAIRPPLFINVWRFITASLTVATLLLVGTAVSSVLAVRRGAATLNAALAALANDLGAPVPRPPVPELADLADHIEGMAGALARAQMDKERLGAELAQRDRLAALGRVAAGVAHEVRNPLAAIKLRVDLGRLRPDTPPPLARELASVSDEITRLDRLVADLLVVAGRRACSRVKTSLGELVEKRAVLLAPWAGERGVHIGTSGSATCALDVDAVARALDNLVRNAVEASPEGGEVEVEVLEDDRSASVRVKDRGKGVDDARVKELFEPFFTTKPDGTGLGLALSRAIAAAHGGTLTYAREAGVTCFELSFPRSAANAAAPGEAA